MAGGQPDPILVLGAGVAGLTAALELAERGVPTVIWSRDDPSGTVSAVAGAIWYPFLAAPRDRVLDWSRSTYQRLRKLARDPAAGVRMRTVIEVFAAEPVDWWWAAVPDGVAVLPAAEVPAPHAAAIRLIVPVIDVPRHLQWLLARLRARGVGVERRAVRSLDEALAAAPTVVNCTGLGARELCADRELVPVRGQVVVLDGATVPHAFLDDTTARPIYVIPRCADVVVGGTADVGAESLVPDPDAAAAMLAAAVVRFPALANAASRTVQVGLRPCRPTVRLEVESRPCGRQIVHNYGHGGSGYTLAFGCAAEVADLIVG